MSGPLGVILAGGLATRMGGGDKALLDLGGVTLLDQVIARLAPQVTGLAINANGDAARFDRFGLPVVADSIEGYAGPLAGVLAGMDWAAGQDAEAIVTVAGDTPFFPTDLVETLVTVSKGQEYPMVLAVTPDGRHPTFGLWPVALRGDLRDALEGGLRKVVQWTDRHGCRDAMFTGAGDPFFNVNTPEDLEKARAIQGGRP